jgi:hypothetical protein
MTSVPLSEPLTEPLRDLGIPVCPFTPVRTRFPWKLVPDSFEIVSVPVRVSGTGPVCTPAYLHDPLSCSCEACGSVERRHPESRELLASRSAPKKIRICAFVTPFMSGSD